MADIITAIKNDPNFCVTVLGTFLAFIGILYAADLKTSKGIKVAVSAGIVCTAIIGVAIIYFTMLYALAAVCPSASETVFSLLRQTVRAAPARA